MRDQQLLEIRPVLDLATTDSTEIETFQNKTLRPILKFQNTLTSQLLDHANHFQMMLGKIDNSDPKAFSEVVNKYISSNIVFKSRVIGIVVGMMTEAECSFYLANTSELNKRIITMQIQRYSDNMRNSLGLNFI